MRTIDRTCKLVCGAAALLISAISPTPASADGMLYGEPVGVRPVLRPVDWSGFYIGGQLGGTWGDVDWTQGNPNFFNTLGATVVGTESSFNAGGVTGGILGGYNIQSESFVFGIELAFNGVGISESQASPFFPATDTFKTEVDFITTITGRVGYAWDNWLVFARGGWAGAETKQTLTSTSSGGVTASKNLFVDGWTVGTGFEVMAWPNVSLGLTYDYIDLNHGAHAISCPACGTGVGLGTPFIEPELKLSTIMARASYMFPINDP